MIHTIADSKVCLDGKYMYIYLWLVSVSYYRCVVFSSTGTRVLYLYSVSAYTYKRAVLV